MAVKILKIPFAMKDGRLVHISEVGSGLQPDCVCPACNSALVARKGKIKVHHFAHSAETNCQPETVTHLLGKQLLLERIKAAIQAAIPFTIAWKCSDCSDTHETNLVEGAARVQLECSLGALRPDLVLFGPTEDVLVVVEVVVSHPPEENVLGYCAANKIPVFEYRIKTLRDLETMRDATQLDPSRSTLCTRPKCEKCGNYLVQRTLFVVPGECWKCGAGMQVAFVNCEGMMLTPEEMTVEEVSEAEKRGACLQKNASAIRGTIYLSNTCKGCGTLTGSHYLHNFWNIAEEVKGLATGMSCMDCATGAEEPDNPPS